MCTHSHVSALVYMAMTRGLVEVTLSEHFLVVAFLWPTLYILHLCLVTFRFPSDATAAVGQRKPFDSVQMTTSSKFLCMFLYF